MIFYKNQKDYLKKKCRYNQIVTLKVIECLPAFFYFLSKFIEKKIYWKVSENPE